MALLDSTREILRLGEQLSGRPIRVGEDRNLSVLATIKMALGDMPMHLISYRPIQGRQPDYHICYQCGFIIRLFETPPADRFDFGIGPNASATMDALLADPSLPPETWKAKDMLMNGLLTQLRSVPIGLRIDEWLWSKYPDLQKEQIASARIQLQQNASALHPTIRKRFPRQVVATNTAMNSAFALFWANKLHDDSVVLPYRAIGEEGAGRALIDALGQVGASPSCDRDLVDRWAEKLGLQGWYKWVPYNLNN
jgi:hypothetical protein